MRTGERKIAGGWEYNHLFPKAQGEILTVKQDATTEHTVALMMRVIENSLDETKAIANLLRDASEKLTLRNVWNFCFNHFQYKLDEKGKEQIKWPSRSWLERQSGIDCDDFVVLVGSILTNLEIPFLIRLTRYQEPTMEHTYIVALSEREVVIDCVVHEFDYEVPYTQKKDYQMTLQELNGIKGERFNEFGDRVDFAHDLPIDAQDLFGDEFSLRGLGMSEQRQERIENRQQRRDDRKADRAVNAGEPKKTINSVNKFNPVTTLFRAGILASMKLNLFSVASTLRFAYLSKEQALKQQMLPQKYEELQRIRQKIERIYYNAGGNAAALREAILNGKGNQDRMVQLSGLGAVIRSLSDEDSLIDILGEDLSVEELPELNSLQGLGSVGAVAATGAAVAAASGMMASVSKVLKKLGGVFKKGSPASEMVLVKANTDAQEERTRRFSVRNLVNNVRSKIQERKQNRSLSRDNGVVDSVESGAENLDENGLMENENLQNQNTPSTDPFTEYSGEILSEQNTTKSAEAPSEGGGIMEWVKANPGKTTLITLGVGLVGYLIVRTVRKPSPSQTVGSLGKISHGKQDEPKKKKNKKSSNAKSHHRLEKLELM